MNTPDIRVGTIVYYDAERQFGFACDGRERVYFHQSQCHDVLEAPGNPMPFLTNQPNDRQPRWRHGQRRNESVVLSVQQGSEGLRAISWGFVRPAVWLEELLRHNRLAWYVGGDLSLRFSHRPHPSPHHREIRGRLTAVPELTPGSSWQLRLEYDVYSSTSGPVHARNGHANVTIRLNEHTTSPSKHQFRRGGRYALDTWLPWQQEWAHIAFSLPSS